MPFFKDLLNKAFRLDAKLLELSKRPDATKDEVIRLVKSGANINTTDEKGRTPLMNAADQNRCWFMEILLDLGASIDAIDQDGQTASMKATSAGRKDALIFLVKRGANTKIKDNHGKTTFDLAGAYITKEVMKKMDNTLIKICCQNKQPTKEEFEQAVKQGAFVDARDENGNTAFIFAAAKGDKETAKTLKELGADVNAENDDGVTACMCAALAKNKDMLTMLVSELDADINAKDIYGNTAFIITVLSNDMETAKHLKELKADINAQNSDGFTACIAAAVNGQTDAIKLLAEWGADINIQTKDGLSACLCAAENGHLETVKALAELGADIFATDREGRSALNYIENVEDRKELIRIYQEKHPEDKREVFFSNTAQPIGSLAISEDQRIPYFAGFTAQGEQVPFYIGTGAQGKFVPVPFRFNTDALGNVTGIQELDKITTNDQEEQAYWNKVGAEIANSAINSDDSTVATPATTQQPVDTAKQQDAIARKLKDIAQDTK